MTHVFISYVREDQAVVDKLANDLRTEKSHRRAKEDAYRSNLVNPTSHRQLPDPGQKHWSRRNIAKPSMGKDVRRFLKANAIKELAESHGGSSWVMLVKSDKARILHEQIWGTYPEDGAKDLQMEIAFRRVVTYWNSPHKS